MDTQTGLFLCVVVFGVLPILAVMIDHAHNGGNGEPMPRPATRPAYIVTVSLVLSQENAARALTAHAARMESNAARLRANVEGMAR